MLLPRGPWAQGAVCPAGRAEAPGHVLEMYLFAPRVHKKAFSDRSPQDVF